MIALKDRLDGLAGAAKLRSNPYVLFLIKLSITAIIALYVPQRRFNRCLFRQTLQSFQSA